LPAARAARTAKREEIQLAASTEQLKLFAAAGTPATDLARLQEYVDAGCTTFCLTPMQKDKIIYQAQLDVFAIEVLPKFRC
jgi:hypothetical protein